MTNVTPKTIELVEKYREEAVASLLTIDRATQEFKDIVEAASEGTGISKTDISTYFKAEFTDKLGDILARAELFSALKGE